MIRAFFRNRARPLYALVAIALMIPAMPMAAIAAGHTTISQGIAGYVTTGEAPGTPVAGATVTAWSTAVVPVVVGTTTSNAEGFYELTLPAGDYYVQFAGAGYFSQFYDGVTELDDATIVTVVAGTIELVELWGQDRYGTAIAISQRSHPSPAGADVVIVARGDLFPDALAGASLAGLYEAPILLTRPTTIPAAVVAEINRLNPDEIIILGETVAVSSGVEAQLAAIVGAGNITRFGGATRYETAVEIAEHVIGELGEAYNGTAFVATGVRFPDALVASPIMAAQGIPLFLSHPTSGLSAHTKAAMDGAVTDAAFIVGGPQAVSNDVEDDLDEMLGEENVERVDGPDRYATAVAVAEFGVEEWGHVWEGVGIATGERFPDALTGGPYQAQIGSVMLLTRIATLSSVTATALEMHNPHICERVHIYGGPLAVSPAVRAAILTIVTPCPSIEWVDAILMPMAVLQLEKEADVDYFVEAGDVITYTYTLSNTGSVVLDAPFTVDDDMFVDPIAVVATDLALGAEASVTATYAVTATDVLAGVVTNTATAQGFYDDAAVLSPAAVLSVELAVPEVTLVKEADVEFFSEVDEEITFTFTLTNTGNVPLAGPFTINDPMVTAVADEPGLMMLAPDASTTFTATYLVTDADVTAGEILNTATAGALFLGEAVVSAEADVTIVYAALGLLKVASTEGPAAVGDEIIYTYTLTNIGEVALDGPFTVVDDNFMAPIEIDPVMWTELAVDASVEVTASYMVTIADLQAGSATNDAYAIGWFGGMEVMSATDTVSIPVEAAPDAVVIQHVFPHPHHHMTIDARGTLTETPTWDPLTLDPADVCVELLNTGAAPVVVDVVLDLDTTLDAQWWYYDTTAAAWLDATEGFSLTLDPGVVEEVCFYAYFESGEFAPFDATFYVYADGTMVLLDSTTFEVNLSSSGG